MLSNIEVAYWRLYGSYWNLYANEQGLRFAYEFWRIAGAKFLAGRSAKADLAQARGQYEQFRGARIQALDAVLENERQLRRLLGMHVEDGMRLVPADSPTLAPYNPDWATSLNEALTIRPELYIARQEVKISQFNLLLAKNNLMPDLRLYANYDVNAIGNRLDGTGSTNADRNLADDKFHNWNIGLRGTIPLGFRNANAALRISRLNLARSYEVLKQEEMKIEGVLAELYREITTYYELIIATRARREAFGEQLDAQFRIYVAGRGTLDLALEAQRNWSQALADEYTNIVGYQQALVLWELGKGSIRRHDNVTIGEGDLPACVAERAVEHQRERSKAIILRERDQAAPPASGIMTGTQAPSLPAVWKTTPPIQGALPNAIPEIPALSLCPA